MPGTTASTPKKVAPAKEVAAPAGKAAKEKATAGAKETHASSKVDGASTAKARAAEKTVGSAKSHSPAEKAHSGKAHAADKAHADGAEKVHATEKAHVAEKAGAVPKARKAAEGYASDHKFLEAQRKALLVERSTYVEQAQSLRAEADSLVEEMEPGDIQFDEESGEGGTVTVDRERDLALSAQALVAVEEIDHALAKIEQGTYGICEGCGTLIPKNRLEALPYARLCIACKSGGLSRR